MLTIFALYSSSYSESTNKMFSGFRSVCVSLFLCMTEEEKKKNQPNETHPSLQRWTKQLYTSDVVRLLTSDCFDDLVSHMPDLVDWKGLEVVFFEKVKRAQSKEFKRNAHMAMVVKPVKHTHTTAVAEERNNIQNTSWP